MSVLVAASQPDIMQGGMFDIREGVAHAENQSAIYQHQDDADLTNQLTANILHHL